MEKLKLREKISYGALDFGYNMPYNLVSTYALLFFTDYLGISNTAAALVMLLVGIWDAINDPMMGVLADRTHLKNGAYRPYLKYSALIYGIAVVLVFMKPDLSQAGKIAWAAFAYCLYTMAETAVSIPYGSLATVMTNDENDRASLAAFRDWGANAGSMLSGLIVVPIIMFFSKGDSFTAGGFGKAAIVFGAIGAAGILITFFGTKERITPDKKHMNVKSALTSVVKNRLAMTLFPIVLMCALAMQFKFTFSTYYCINYLENEYMLSVMFTLVGLMPVCIIPFMPKIIEKIGNKNVFFGAGISIFLSGLCTLLGGTSPVMFILSSVFMGLMISCTMCNTWYCIPFVSDWGEWASGLRLTGFLYGMVSLVSKLSTSVCNGLNGVVLNLIHYDGMLETQSAATINGLHYAFALIPMVCGVLILLVVIPFKSTHCKEMQDIKAELVARRGEISEDE